jgi:periplasmic divalent cation tolerance protein
MTDDDVVVVLCTVPTEGGHAERLARSLVETRLAGCVNVLGPVRSIYEWRGSVHDEAELQLVIKTTAGRYAELEAHVRREHPYDVPEILALPVALGSAPYLDWVRAQTR